MPDAERTPEAGDTLPMFDPDAIPTSSASGEEGSVEDGPEGADRGRGRRKSPGEAVLKTIEINPVVLSRAVVLANVVATEYGLTDAERDEIAVFVRENDILLAVDLDQGVTATHPAEGEGARPRPLRFRFQVPLLSGEGRGGARMVGLRLRTIDLMKALRNRVENSENYGVLSGDTPVTIEVFSDLEADGADELSETPSRVVVHPTQDGSLSPREFPVLGGVSPDAFELLTPRTADAGLAQMDPEALIEIAGLTDPDAGVLLDPEEPAHLVGVSEQGIALSSLSPPESDATTSDADRQLDGPVVLSPRLATALGLAQAAMEEVQKGEQRAVTAEHASSVVMAGMAAALEVSEAEGGANPALGALRRAVGEKPTRRALSSARRKDSAVDQSVRFAEKLLADHPDADIGLLADALSSAFEEEVADLAPNMVSVARERLGGDRTGASLAAAYLAGTATPDRLSNATSAAVGEVMLREEARQIVGSTPDAEAVEDVGYFDYAAAAWAITGRQWKRAGRATLEAVPTDRTSAWWDEYRSLLTHPRLAVPADAIEALLPDIDAGEELPRPDVKNLKIPSHLREQWIEDRVRSVQGRLWCDEDGRVNAGFGDAGSGTIMLSDLAVRPDPGQFPLRDHAMLEDLRTPGSDYDWKSEVPTTDFETVADRVTSLTLGRKERFQQQELETLFVGRWTPPNHPEGPDGGALGTLEEETRVVPSNEVTFGEGDEARHFVLGRSSRTRIEDEAEAGTLRVFGFDRDGEHLAFSVPMTEVPRGEAPDSDRPVAFALDASQLGHLTRFVTEKGTKARLSVREGLVYAYDTNRSRIVILPSVEATRVPEELRPLVEAAGAERSEPAQDAPHQMNALDGMDVTGGTDLLGDDIFERARGLRRARERRERTGASPRPLPSDGPSGDEARSRSEDAIEHRGSPGLKLDLSNPDELTLRQIQRRLDRLRQLEAGWLEQLQERQTELFPGASDSPETIEVDGMEVGVVATKGSRQAANALAEVRKNIRDLEAIRAGRQKISDRPPTAGEIRRGAVEASRRRRLEREMGAGGDVANEDGEEPSGPLRGR